MTQYTTYDRTQELRDILAEKLLEAEDTYERIDAVYDFLKEQGLYSTSGEGLFATAFGQGYEAGYQAAAAKAYQAALRLAYPRVAAAAAAADADAAATAPAEGGE